MQVGARLATLSNSRPETEVSNAGNDLREIHMLARVNVNALNAVERADLDRRYAELMTKCLREYGHEKTDRAVWYGEFPEER